MLFWEKVNKTSGCWNWTGALNGRGYGVFNLGEGNGYAHRISYTISNGKIPDDKQLDHTCSNPACVNPKHLEAVSAWENNVRSGSMSSLNMCKIMCKNGHFFDEKNTYFRKEDGSRQCRACGRKRSRDGKRARNPMVVLSKECVSCGDSFPWSSWRPEKIYCNKKCGDKVRMKRFFDKKDRAQELKDEGISL